MHNLLTILSGAIVTLLLESKSPMTGIEGKTVYNEILTVTYTQDVPYPLTYVTKSQFSDRFHLFRFEFRYGTVVKRRDRMTGQEYLARGFPDSPDLLGPMTEIAPPKEHHKQVGRSSWIYGTECWAETRMASGRTHKTWWPCNKASRWPIAEQSFDNNRLTSESITLLESDNRSELDSHFAIPKYVRERVVDFKELNKQLRDMFRNSNEGDTNSCRKP